MAMVRNARAMAMAMKRQCVSPPLRRCYAHTRPSSSPQSDPRHEDGHRSTKNPGEVSGGDGHRSFEISGGPYGGDGHSSSLENPGGEDRGDGRHRSLENAVGGPDGGDRHRPFENTGSPSNSGKRKEAQEPRGSVNPSEVAKFAAMAHSWWDTEGPYKPLHKMNPVRISFIRSALCRHFGRDSKSAKPLDGLRIIDVGCGGGLVCEPLARMGAQVIGIDASEENIHVATLHSMRDPSTASIQYRCITAEQLVEDKEEFDVVIALEVIEHVAEPMPFVESLCALTKKNGTAFISTINRSIPGYLLAIFAAEYILRWLPKGTHEWSKFIKPEELALITNGTELQLQEVAGMAYNPLFQTWSLSEDTSVNYIMFATKSAPLISS